MVKVKLFLCVCLCVVAVLTGPAKGDSIQVVNPGDPNIPTRLTDLIVYGEDPNKQRKVIKAPDDPSDDIVFTPGMRRIFHAPFKITKYEISAGWYDSKGNYEEFPTIYFDVNIVKPKKVGFIRDPDGQQKVVLAVDQAVAPEPPPEGTVLAFIEGYNELMPGWFVGTDINFETGEVTGAYTGLAEVFSTAFEVTLFDFYPPDGAVDVPLDAKLCWPKSEEAVSYDVYFGTDFDDVKYGRRGTFKGSQLGTTYDPGTLEPCYDYFWNIEPFIEEEEEEEEEPPIFVDSVITTGEVRIYADMYIGDVWSFKTAGRKATNPHPVNGAIHVDPNVILSWTPGCWAALHDVYLGIDFYAVANADTSDTTGIYRARLDVNSYDPGTLDPGTSYYWKIEGVNEPNKPPPTWQGPIWSFKTADDLFMDGMESYTDDLGNRIFETWIDGLGYTDPLNLYHIGNMTGLMVYIDSVTVHEGTQSMRFVYDNESHIIPPSRPKPPPDPNSDPNKPPPDPNKPSIRKAFYSEAERSFDTPQDWARCGVKALSLWLYGDPANAPEPMYVAVEDTTGMSAVVVHDNPAAAQTDTWTEWSIDPRQFADQGMNLADVSSIAIGFGDRDNPQLGGTGTVYFDNITLGTGPCADDVVTVESDSQPDKDCDGKEYVIYRASAKGVYHITISASNEFGHSECDVEATLVEESYTGQNAATGQSTATIAIPPGTSTTFTTELYEEDPWRPHRPFSLTVIVKCLGKADSKCRISYYITINFQ